MNLYELATFLTIHRIVTFPYEIFAGFTIVFIKSKVPYIIPFREVLLYTNRILKKHLCRSVTVSGQNLVVSSSVLKRSTTVFSF